MPDVYHVIITERALAALQEIFNYIQHDSPQNAAEVIERLLDEIDDLEFMPSRFKVVGRSRKHRSPIHARTVKPFLVYYRIDEPRRAVFIDDVRRGTRRPSRRFD